MEKSRTTNLSLPNALDILTSLSIKLSVMLSQWSENQNLPATFGQITYFNSDQNFGPNQLSTENNTPESQEILKFMLEIHKVVNLSLEASVLILEYLDRYFHNQVIAVFELNWKQVLLASILSAKKAVTYFCSSELSS